MDNTDREARAGTLPGHRKERPGSELPEQGFGVADLVAAGHEVEWRWIKGHAGDPGNERADELARQGVEEITGKRY